MMVKKFKVNLNKFRKPRKDSKSVKPVKKAGQPDWVERTKKLGKR